GLREVGEVGRQRRLGVAREPQHERAREDAVADVARRARELGDRLLREGPGRARAQEVGADRDRLRRLLARAQQLELLRGELRRRGGAREAAQQEAEARGVAVVRGGREGALGVAVVALAQLGAGAFEQRLDRLL